jgi:hypothetical protein
MKALYLNELQQVGDLVPNIDSLILPVLVHVCKIFQGSGTYKFFLLTIVIIYKKHRKEE